MLEHHPEDFMKGLWKSHSRFQLEKDAQSSRTAAQSWENKTFERGKQQKRSTTMCRMCPPELDFDIASCGRERES
jgi:hypothetical protein